MQLLAVAERLAFFPSRRMADLLTPGHSWAVVTRVDWVAEDEAGRHWTGEEGAGGHYYPSAANLGVCVVVVSGCVLALTCPATPSFPIDAS
jgi:hypothetical protein